MARICRILEETTSGDNIDLITNEFQESSKNLLSMDVNYKANLFLCCYKVKLGLHGSLLPFSFPAVGYSQWTMRSDLCF